MAENLTNTLNSTTNINTSDIREVKTSEVNDEWKVVGPKRIKKIKKSRKKSRKIKTSSGEEDEDKSTYIVDRDPRRVFDVGSAGILRSHRRAVAQPRSDK